MHVVHHTYVHVVHQGHELPLQSTVKPDADPGSSRDVQDLESYQTSTLRLSGADTYRQNELHAQWVRIYLSRSRMLYN